MTELSPQAQAVLDAADAVLEQGSAPTWLVARGIAAALRAAANQLDHATSAHTLYAFADELEGNR
jgi:hypothetical protein